MTEDKMQPRLWTDEELKQQDMDGSPCIVKGMHFRIKFQLGPVKEVGLNGCQIPQVLDVLLDRMRGFQEGPFKCRENALVITKLEEAMHWLGHRKAERERRGVEGYNKL